MSAIFEKGFYGRIPNIYLKDSRLLNNKLILVIFFLDKSRNKDGDDELYGSLDDLVIESGYKLRNGKGYSTYQFREQLQFLIDNNMFEFVGRYKNIDIMTYETSSCFKGKIKNDFNIVDGYTQLYTYERDILVNSSCNIDKAKLVWFYLYIKSFFWEKKEKEDFESKEGQYIPCAFFKSIENIVIETGVPRKTINICFNEYIKMGLLKKYETGSYINNKNKRQNAPNIYVKNNVNAEKEINLALKRLKYMYSVKNFMPMIKKKGKEQDIND